ncbi:MAG: site-2 protease family protein [Candidatus Omnitrophota bacterium]|nr:site-2 protease family protein [Candidatus Omnitrophota bacterium]MBU1928813.1 site-2 protease family protein [Candidatus Omnitrophota bacterium]MBU2035509.1 site-2 protease family protein [Candidatus Omnitrophota bacterium]MBU2222135.1 site-2 protease family protein [Candidatus Omnitrophota bacterium]
MGLISLLFSNPGFFIILAGTLLYSVILHEVAHGWVAHLFGDDTAIHYGRLTLNPASHIDPVGTLMLFLVGFGWARPVPVDYSKFSNTRFGLFCVALAGCLTNILIAIAALILLQLRVINTNPVLSAILPIVVKINIILGAFNLIPVPPLDGSKILMSFLPYRAQESLASLEPYGFYILVFLLFTGLLNPVIAFMQNLIYGIISILFIFFR